MFQADRNALFAAHTLTPKNRNESGKHHDARTQVRTQEGRK